MRPRSLVPLGFPGASITTAADSRSSRFTISSGFPSAPSAFCTIASLRVSTYLYSDSVLLRTSEALSSQEFTLSGFWAASDSSCPYIAALRWLTFAFDRLRPSCTCVKPSRTSLDTLSASMAVKTIYMRFIIFWRGESRVLFAPIALFYFTISPFTCTPCSGVTGMPSIPAPAAPMGRNMLTVMAFIIFS